MPAANPASSAIRFGPFELDVRTGELKSRNRLIPLQDQPLRLLALLLARQALRRGLLSEADFRAVHDFVAENLPFRLPRPLPAEDLIRYAKRDKKVADGQVNLVLAEKPGASFRPARAPAAAADTLRECVRSGRQDGAAVEAVLASGGHRRACLKFPEWCSRGPQAARPPHLRRRVVQQ